MQVQAVHHVAVATRDPERSLGFYCGVLGLTPVPRPNFPVGGAIDQRPAGITTGQIAQAGG